MKLVLDDQALEDLRLISNWIARDNPRAADALITRIFDKIERLETPELTDMGRPGSLLGTRELIEYPYIIVYEVHDDRSEVIVRAVVHGAQDKP
jgi:addiction module RelE/StbE family toxin